MSRQRLFPTKSRYQVALCLQKLTMAMHCTGSRANSEFMGEDFDRANVLLNLSTLCYTRLVNLQIPVVFEPKAITYNYTLRQGSPVHKIAIGTVRGWRKRHPDLLNTITKEQKSNGS